MTTNAYQIWLTFDGERQKFRFPVHPEKINLKQGSSNQTVAIAGLGQVTIMQDRQEAEVSWSSFFPAKPFPGLQVNSLTWPEEIKFTIKTWMFSKKPCHLIVTGTKINLYCTIERFDCSESGGAVGDLDYTITFKEYRQPTICQVDVQVQVEDAKEITVASVGDAEERTDNTVMPSTYTVVSGDCLYNIALKQYGNASRWPEIASLNGIPSPYIIHPGQILNLPS